MKTLEEAAAESTCQKRLVVCEIYDEFGKILAVESNRCSPTGGLCHRIGIVQTKSDYDVTSACNWTHAEVMAIRALPGGRHHPYRAVIYGHDYPCDACDMALRRVGVETIDIKSASSFLTHSKPVLS